MKLKKVFMLMMLLITVSSTAFAGNNTFKTHSCGHSKIIHEAFDKDVFINRSQESLKLISMGIEAIVKAKFEIRNAIGVVDNGKIGVIVVQDNSDARSVFKDVQGIYIDAVKVNQIAQNGTVEQKENIRKALSKANYYEREGKQYFVRANKHISWLFHRWCFGKVVYDLKSKEEHIIYRSVKETRNIAIEFERDIEEEFKQYYKVLP